MVQFLGDDKEWCVVYTYFFYLGLLSLFPCLLFIVIICFHNFNSGYATLSKVYIHKPQFARISKQKQQS